MKLLIVAAVAAVTAIVVVLVMKNVSGPWSGEDGTVRTAIAGAVSGVVGVFVARSVRKDK